MPKEFRFRGAEVEIFRRGEEVVLRERVTHLDRAFEVLASLPDDFPGQGRNDTPPQRREDL